MARAYAICWLLMFSIASWWLLQSAAPNLAGIVRDDAGPLAQANVGFQGDADRVVTNRQGHFRLRGSVCAKRVIAHKAGYRIASALASKSPLLLRLERLPREDNADYTWIEPRPDTEQAKNCANCHGEIYREWRTSAHANSATNVKFLHLFAGGDGKTPPQKTWNATAEHPDGAAVCATCHVPTLVSPTLEYDVREAKGDAKSGIHCDYCHKVAGVTDKLGNRFGRDALELLRPAANDAIAYGPLDDAVRSGESFAYSPVYKESRYCAACHEGTVFGVHAYSTYSEWLESPAKKRGQQCQDCHMAPTGTMTNIAPGKGGIERRASTLASHHTPGGERGMLRHALSMKAIAKADALGWRVEVDIVARSVGHRLPTGFVDRQLILVVQATDHRNAQVELSRGSTLPKSTGKWSGRAGALFAKQLTGENNREPAPFWVPIFDVRDTRLKPEEPDARAFVFADGARRATVQLWYRRFWQEVANARGWTDNDLLVQEMHLSWEPTR